MSLFVCEVCEHVDDQELVPAENRTDCKCTVCLGLLWHGHFDRVKYDPERDFVINRPTGIGLGGM